MHIRQAQSDLSKIDRLQLMRVDMGLKDVATPHGFRSSFKDWAAENGVADDVSEAALNHAQADRVKAAYLRTKFLDQRRKVMDDWGRFVMSGCNDS